MTTHIKGVTLVPGAARGDVFGLTEPLSFWGGLDPANGKIIDRRHPQAGISVSGTILFMQAGRGSSSGSSVLAEAIRAGSGPAAIVMSSRDAIVTTGALVAAELYDRHCAIMLLTEADWAIGSSWRMAVVEAGGRSATIRRG